RVVLPDLRRAARLGPLQPLADGRAGELGRPAAAGQGRAERDPRDPAAGHPWRASHLPPADPARRLARRRPPLAAGLHHAPPRPRLRRGELARDGVSRSPIVPSGSRGTTGYGPGGPRSAVSSPPRHPRWEGRTHLAVAPR